MYLAIEIGLQVWENCGDQWPSAVYEKDRHSQFDMTDMWFMDLFEFSVWEGELHQMDTVMLI